MKWSASTLAAALVLVASSSSSSPSSVEAFTPTTTTSITSRTHSRNHLDIHTFLTASNQNTRHHRSIFLRSSNNRHTQLNMSSLPSYTVGIVGATGAVGKEIRNCLEKREFPVSTLRIFGSERSAGSQIETEKYGTITVELFDVAAAKQCDVVFLAVSGEFSLKHARALSDGADGCVVIDNSVRIYFILYFSRHIFYLYYN